jgi:aspartate/glutamate racemase
MVRIGEAIGKEILDNLKNFPNRKKRMGALGKKLLQKGIECIVCCNTVR